MIKLQLPLRNIKINQPFGVNFVNFYQKLGLVGHNGVDFEARNGFECYAAHSGKVRFAGDDGSGGICVEIVEEDEHYKTIYYHLKDVCVKVGQRVRAGDLIAHCDNTGVYTTGSHLHFGLKRLDTTNSYTIGLDNGYKGAIDPMPYFLADCEGWDISNKDAGKSNAYHRYFRGRPKGGYQNEVRILAILTKKGIFPTAEKINALVYGGWDLEAVQNPAMYEIWAYVKKDDYLNHGVRPFKS